MNFLPLGRHLLDEIGGHHLSILQESPHDVDLSSQFFEVSVNSHHLRSLGIALLPRPDGVHCAVITLSVEFIQLAMQALNGLHEPVSLTA